VPIKKIIHPGKVNLSEKLENRSEGAEGNWTLKANQEEVFKMRAIWLMKDWQNQFLCGRHSFERTYFTPGFTPMVHNRIGQKWVYGGAHLLAKLLCVELMDQYERRLIFPHVVDGHEDTLNGEPSIPKIKQLLTEEQQQDHYMSTKGDFPDVEWVKVSEGTQLCADGDVSGLDYTIKALFLVIYMMCGSLWTHQQNTHMYRMYRYFLEAAAENLAGKSVRWFTDFMLVIGIMPSGSFETSHGNTWIMTVCYFLTFFYYVLSTCTPEEVAQYLHFVAAGRVVVTLYGDDFLYSYPKELRKKFGIKKFRKFLRDFLHVELKHCKEYGTLITYLTLHQGRVCRGRNVFGHLMNGHVGPVFLKRHLIPWNTFCLERFQVPAPPRYVPWRPLVQFYQKCGVPKAEQDRAIATPLSQLSRIVGLMYDNLGVDPVAHRFLSYQWDRSWAWFNKNYVSPKSRKDVLYGLNHEVDAYCRKIGLNGVFSLSKPSRIKLLNLHSVDIRRHFRPFKGATWQEKASFEEFYYTEL